jgi:TRAP transporter 4TM/12TM fusion protein
MLTFFSCLLCLFTILFVNFNVLQPQSALALFTLFGMLLCFLSTPGLKKFARTADRNSGNSTTDPDLPAEIGGRDRWLAAADRFSSWLLAGLSVICFGYIFIQTEPVFSQWWAESEFFSRPVSLGERAGDENLRDYWIGLLGLVLVLEGARRTIGWVVPLLALLFILHAYFAPQLPEWLLPHNGQTPKQIVSSTFLQSLGVLGPAIAVMFKFVFLFVVFGAFLEMSGATQFIIDFSQQIFRNSVGGPAKVSVLSSGLMGSLSGSAVANAVTTGTFTIPMMKSSGFKSHEAAAVEAAAGTGGAMVPPVMGAAAYMMLELVEGVTFLQIVKAAIIPAILYYLSLFLIVHFHAKKSMSSGNRSGGKELIKEPSVAYYEGLIFFGSLGFLVALLFANFSPFKAVTAALVLILLLTLFRSQWKIDWKTRGAPVLAFLLAGLLHQLTFYLGGEGWAQQSMVRPLIATSWFHPEGYFSLRLGFESLLNSAVIASVTLILLGLLHPYWRPLLTKALRTAAQNGVPLIAASACVGIIIGIVQATPMANDFSGIIKSLISTHLLLALIGIMGCSIVLGMGVPSVVCYLLMATLMGSLLVEMQVPLLAAHFFMLYFGMMSMVTPPVALAAYAAASIAEAPVMKTAWTAFRFSLVGFCLPFMFVYQPALLLLAPEGETLQWGQILFALVPALLGVTALSAAVVGFFRQRLNVIERLMLVAAAVLLMVPIESASVWGWTVNALGLLLMAAVTMLGNKKPR